MIPALTQDAIMYKNLTKVWEVSEGLDVPESVHFNNVTHLFYVSNIVGRYDVKDGKGCIATLNINGEFVQKDWVHGLNGPKGICSTKTKLYVTDIDRVLEIDLITGQILTEFKNSKSVDLNDVAIASDGQVFVTDSGSNCLFIVRNNSMEVFIQDDLIKGMNGIYIEGNTLYLGAHNKLLTVDLKTMEIEDLEYNTGYIDGIVKVTKNQFITSDFAGKIQLIQIGMDIEKLIDTSSEKINAADLTYLPSLKLLVVPTFNNNRLIAYKLNKL